MNIEEFRNYCLSFKGVREKMPFPHVPDKYSREILCFYVCDKWFCFVNIEVFDFCCIKCSPSESEELQDNYAGVKPGLAHEQKTLDQCLFQSRHYRPANQGTCKEILRTCRKNPYPQ